MQVLSMTFSTTELNIEHFFRKNSSAMIQLSPIHQLQCTFTVSLTNIWIFCQ